MTRTLNLYPMSRGGTGFWAPADCGDAGAHACRDSSKHSAPRIVLLPPPGHALAFCGLLPPIPCPWLYAGWFRYTGTWKLARYKPAWNSDFCAMQSAGWCQTRGVGLLSRNCRPLLAQTRLGTVFIRVCLRNTLAFKKTFGCEVPEPPACGMPRALTFEKFYQGR